MFRILIFAYAFLLLLSSVASVPISSESLNDRAPEVTSPAAWGFDYVHLVQEWPGSFCDTSRGCRWPSAPPKEGEWLLHGLWPEFFNGSWPQYCDSKYPFNATQIQDLLPDLQRYWPSLVSPKQADFWSHEWTRHGTCCEKLTPKEHAYFKLVLHLRKSFDAASILKKAGILPSKSSVSQAGKTGHTTWSAVKHALDTGFKHKVEVGCGKDKDGNLQLSDLRSCYVPVKVSPGATIPEDSVVVDLDGENGAGGKIVVKRVSCKAEGDFHSCKTADTPVLYPSFHPKELEGETTD